MSAFRTAHEQMLIDRQNKNRGQGGGVSSHLQPSVEITQGGRENSQNIGNFLVFLYKDKNRGQGGVSTGSHHQISFKLEEQMLGFLVGYGWE